MVVKFIPKQKKEKNESFLEKLYKGWNGNKHKLIKKSQHNNIHQY